MISFLIGVAAVTYQPVQRDGAQASDRPMQCEAGPLRRTYGGQPWQVYACSDGATLIVAAEQGNPAQPFYFILFPRDGAYQVYGEGTGSQAASSAAYRDLQQLTPDAVRALLREAQGSPQPR